MMRLLKRALADQFEAALSMLDECLRRCPAQHWDERVGKRPFWRVAYHTLFFTDMYLSRSQGAFTAPRIGRGSGGHEGLHLDKASLRAYAAVCRRKAVETIAAETAASLGGPSGFRRLRFSRFEAHLYNLRHVQHHTGQLSAFLRRIGGEPHWVKRGWK